MKKTNKTFHEQVKDALDGRKNKFLHEKTGIAQSEISRILQGKLIPSQKQYDKICAIFPSIEFINPINKQ